MLSLSALKTRKPFTNRTLPHCISASRLASCMAAWPLPALCCALPATAGGGCSSLGLLLLLLLVGRGSSGAGCADSAPARWPLRTCRRHCQHKGQCMRLLYCGCRWAHSRCLTPAASCITHNCHCSASNLAVPVYQSRCKFMPGADGVINDMLLEDLKCHYQHIPALRKAQACAGA